MIGVEAMPDDGFVLLRPKRATAQIGKRQRFRPRCFVILTHERTKPQTDRDGAKQMTVKMTVIRTGIRSLEWRFLTVMDWSSLGLGGFRCDHGSNWMQ